jgi:translation initiation factor IF-2
MERLNFKSQNIDKVECIVIESRAQVDTLSSTAILDDKSKNATDADTNICSVVVKNGTLKLGSYVLYGDNTKGSKIIKIKNEKGHLLRQANAGEIVEIVGLENLPEVGDILKGVSDTLIKKIMAIRNDYESYRKKKNLEKKEFSSIKLKKFKTRRERRKFYGDSKNVLKIHQEKELEINELLLYEADTKKKNELLNQLSEIQQMIMQLKEQNKKINPVIIKANESGKLHAIQSQIEKQFGKDPGFSLEIIDVGPLTQSDVDIALELEATVMTVDLHSQGFLENELEENNIQIKNYQLVHEMLNHLKDLHEEGIQLKKMENDSNNFMDLKSMKLEGKTLVKMVFNTKFGKVAGVNVSGGRIKKEGVFRVLRNGMQVASNLKIKSLKQIKSDVEIIREGDDGGIGLENFDDFKVDDIIECYTHIN